MTDERVFRARSESTTGLGIRRENEVIQIEGPTAYFGYPDSRNVTKKTGSPMSVNHVVADAVIIADIRGKGISAACVSNEIQPEAILLIIISIIVIGIV